MNIFDTAVNFVLDREGGYSNDPTDPGGETNFGIAKKFHPNVDIKNLTQDGAVVIYKQEYWDKCRCGDMPAPIAVILFDASVNQGQPHAVTMLQKALLIASDGVCGSQTVAAAQRVFSPKLIAEFIARRMYAYGLDPKFAKDGLGWSRRLAACIELALTPVLF